MKSLKVTVTTFLASMMLFGCKKDSSTTNNQLANAPAGSTNLEINVLDGSTAKSGASVYLFTSQSDWDNFVNNGASTYLKSGVTDGSGAVAFINLDPSANYYWYAISGCENSFNDSASTSGTITSAVTTTASVFVEQTESVTITNSNNFWSATVTINNTSYGSISPQHSITIPYLPLGSYSGAATSAEPLDLGSPEAISFTLTTCGSTKPVTVHP